MELRKFLTTVKILLITTTLIFSFSSCQEEETVITEPNPSEIIESESPLTSLLSRVTSMDNEGDIIESIDIQYPISISVFNTSFDVVETENINSDVQFSSFLETLEENIIASLNYPVTLFYADETSIEVNDNEMLMVTISEAIDFDNEEITVGNCTLISITENLSNCRWDITRYSINDEFEDFTFTFSAGSIASLDNNTDIIQIGSWEVSESDDKLLLNVSTELIEFTWEIVECGDEFIQASGDNETIRLRQNCNTEEEIIEDTAEVTEAKDLLANNCIWVIDRYLIDGNNSVSDFTGSSFEFSEDGTFIFSNSTNIYNGTWNITTDDENILTLVLESSESLPEYIDHDYMIEELREGFTLLKANDTEQEIIVGFEPFCTIN